MRPLQYACVLLLISTFSEARIADGLNGVPGPRRALRQDAKSSLEGLFSSWRRSLLQLPSLPAVPGLTGGLDAVVEDVVDGAIHLEGCYLC